ncbi:MAG: hypothetical protein ACXVC6_13560 [Bacteroidia bacterium]
MELKEAQSLCEEYRLIYEEKEVRNLINEQWYFLNSVDVVHLPPFDETSYEVMVNTIRDGNLIPFKLEVAIRNFGKPL